MKKVIAVLMLMVFVAPMSAFAAARGTAEYEALKEYKKKKKAEKEAAKANPVPKEKGFWQREAERSGFAGTGAMFTSGIKNVMPFDAPNSRKESA